MQVLRSSSALVSRWILGGALFSLAGFATMGVGCQRDAGATETGKIAITADGDGFKPSSVNLKKGASATLVFTRTTDETCATQVVFPELDIKKDLPKNTPVSIVVPTDRARKLTFQCGMGMYKSSVVISE